MTNTNHKEASDKNHNMMTNTNHKETSDKNHNMMSNTNHKETSDKNHNMMSNTNHNMTSDTNHNMMTNTNHKDDLINSVHEYKSKIFKAIDLLSKNDYNNFQSVLTEIENLFSHISLLNSSIPEKDLLEITDLITKLRDLVSSNFMFYNDKMSTLKKTEVVLNNYYKNVNCESKFVDQKR